MAIKGLQTYRAFWSCEESKGGVNYLPESESPAPEASNTEMPLICRDVAERTRVELDDLTGRLDV